MIRSISFALAALTVMGGAGSKAADCYDYRAGMHVVGGVDTNHIVNDIAPIGTDGRRFVAAHGYLGLWIINGSSPARPIVERELSTEQYAYRVATSGNVAFVSGLRSNLLEIFGVGSSSTAGRIGSIETEGQVSDITASNGYLFAATEAGLEIYSVVDAQSPRRISVTPMPGEALDVAVRGSIAYVAAGYAGLTTVDITRPQSPVIRDHEPYSAVATCVAISGKYCFVGNRYPGIEVVDISDPGSLDVVGSIESPIPSPNDLQVRGSFLYASEDVQFSVIGISEPTRPRVLGVIDTPGMASSCALAGDYAFVADGLSGVQVLYIGNPETATMIGSAKVPASATGVRVYGDKAFVTAQARGLYVIDLRNDAHPELMASLTIPGGAMDLDIQGSLAFVAAGHHGLQVVDISTPSRPSIVGSADIEGTSFAVKVEGPYAYVGSDKTGLQIVDIRRRDRPRCIGSLAIEGTTVSIAMYSHYIYAVSKRRGYFSNYTGWLNVVDVTDPYSPVLVSRRYLSRDLYGLAISSHYAYVQFSNYNYAYTNSGLGVFDIMRPEEPSLISITEFTSTYSRRIAVDGATVYYANGWGGVTVLDVTNPSRPVVNGAVDTPGFATGVGVFRGHVVVADGEGGVIVVPRECDGAIPEALHAEVDVLPGNDGANAHIGTGLSRTIPMAIVSTPELPASSIDQATVRVGPMEVAEAHVNVWGTIRHEEDVNEDGVNDLILHFSPVDAGLAAGDQEFTVKGMTFAGEYFEGTASLADGRPDGRRPRTDDRELRVSPNPFNPETAITFTLDKAQRVCVDVFDIRGRRVARLFDRIYAPGSHSVMWRGRDSHGRPVTSGQYFLRVETADGPQIAKVLLLK